MYIRMLKHTDIVMYIHTHIIGKDYICIYVHTHIVCKDMHIHITSCMHINVYVSMYITCKNLFTHPTYRETVEDKTSKKIFLPALAVEAVTGLAAMVLVMLA